MEIGTGIFLASVVLGLILLYGQTKEKWNWKKIVLRTLCGSIALAGIVTLLIWIYGKYETRVFEQTEFLTIALGDKASDVKFKKGAPTSEDGHVWIYKKFNEDESVVIFKDTEVRAILYIGSCLYCYRISGLGIGTDYAEVKNKLGDPTFVSISSDQLERLASYKKWNLVFRLKKNMVEAIGIYNPKFEPLAFSKQASNAEPLSKSESNAPQSGHE